MIDFEHCTKGYSSLARKAVNDLTLHIEGGQIFGFLGPNGAGKSTTIKMLVGMLHSDSGMITIDGKKFEGDGRDVKSLLGYVPDEPLFYDKMTAYRHLNFIGDVFGIPLEERQLQIDTLSERFELKDSLSDEIGSFSHGMKQKLAVISALLHSPKLLVLDEPMVGLDPKAAFLLKQTMRMYADQGNTVFFSTHIMEVAQDVCDRIGIIDKGTLLFDGTVKELQTQKGKGNENLEQLFLDLTKGDKH
ncbi:MAG: ABC transporter ATP-binding protein [Sphaerochaeta sp.]|nr:ABC transporter ATP-binding protein [Sphaerochaeta sp.]